MKSTLKISVLSLCCVAFGASGMNVHAAPAVRALGGSGTVSATSAANSSSGAMTSAARAGTIRTGATTSSSGTTSSPATGATSARLSIGKYLGSGTSLKNNTTIKKPSTSVNTNPGTSGGDFSAADLDDLNKRIDGLDDQIGRLDDKFTGFEGNLDGKQDVLNGSDYIYIENDTVGLELDKLADYLGDQLGGGIGGGADGTDGREVVLRKTDTEIQWQYVGDTTWNTLIAIDELKGEPGKDGESGAIDPDVLKATVDAAVATAVANFVTADEVANIVTSLTQNYVTTDMLTNLVTQEQLDELKESMSGSLGREVQLQATATEIQWRYVGDESWKTLIELDKLRGPEGPQGPAGTVDDAVLDAAISTAIDNIKNDLLDISGAPQNGAYVPVVNNGETTWVPVVDE